MPGSLSGRVAVVTGAGRGIGAAITRGLAGQGAAVVLVGRDRARLEEQAADLGGPASVQTADITDEANVKSVFAAIRTRHPRIDILVNSAGQAGSSPLAKMDLAHWNSMIAVNLTGTFLCAREVVQAMSKQDYGRIVNVASTAGLIGYAYIAAYAAAKHGVIGLTRSLALETAKSRLTVNAVCPGFTETDIVKDAITNIMAKTGKSEADARAALVATNPQGRMVQPAEVANAVLWLCLPGSESITGQAVSISGGEVMR